jgi:hypothetical protein
LTGTIGNIAALHLATVPHPNTPITCTTGKQCGVWNGHQPANKSLCIMQIKSTIFVSTVPKDSEAIVDLTLNKSMVLYLQVALEQDFSKYIETSIYRSWIRRSISMVPE